jgi:putative transport protein
MLDVLADNPVLTLFLVVGLGSALGLVPFGPIRFALDTILKVLLVQVIVGLGG